ncbi:MAG: DNA-directed RNA polymerase subunit omega [Nitrospirae bacterium]|nr:DNA-directed RNA polymerase subunit omega [Nitrospirota bacterium]
MKDIVSLPMETPGPGVDSKYRLCVVAGQRALQIIKGSKARIDVPYCKPTTVALAEVQGGLVPFAQDDDAFKAREADEVTYKTVLAETRAAYVDEEGNALFSHHGPSAPAAARNEPHAAPAPAG